MALTQRQGLLEQHNNDQMKNETPGCLKLSKFMSYLTSYMDFSSFDKYPAVSFIHSLFVATIDLLPAEGYSHAKCKFI